MTAVATPGRVIAYLGEDRHYEPLLRQAIRMARESGAELVLYDADAATIVGAPLPTNWSGEGSDELFSDLLSPEDLERAGRAKLGDLVRTARAAGIEAAGWLPGSRGADALAEYAEKVGATLILLPADLDDRSFMDRLRGAPSPGDVAEKTHRPTIVVATGDEG
jgi:nucleotide-binding universal stress UspA family protein